MLYQIQYSFFHPKYFGILFLFLIILRDIFLDLGLLSEEQIQPASL